MDRNKEPGPGGRRLTRAIRYLRKLPGRHGRHGRTVQDQMIRGASYSLGSGAVSILILWMEARR
jgi:hypothetical protein